MPLRAERAGIGGAGRGNERTVAAEQVQRGQREATATARLLTEALGTFIYVCLGAGVLASARLFAAAHGRALTNADWLTVGFAHGLALFIAAQVAQRISGAHINPAVTLALAAVARFGWRGVPLQLAAQFAGATLGAAAIFVVFGRDAATIGHLGAPEFAPQTSLLQDAAIEALGTAVLMLTLMGASLDARAPAGWGAFTTGMSVVAVTFFLGPVTSAVINPARAFGPDLVSMFFGVPISWTAYVVNDLLGPLAGALVAAVVYLRVTRPLWPEAGERNGAGDGDGGASGASGASAGAAGESTNR